MKSVRKLIAVALCLAMLTGALAVSASAAAVGTKSAPKEIEYNSMFLGYLMNDKVEAGDSDGIWYTMTAHKAGIMYIEINGPTDVAFDVEVTAGGYTGRASESNPVITYPVAQGDVITVHKYVIPDGSGNIAAASINAYGIIVAGNEDEPLNMIDEQIKVPVAAGSSATLTEKKNRIKLYGNALEISAPKAALRNTVVSFNGRTYQDVDGDGKIEMPLTGSYESRPPVTITNKSGQNVVYTFNVVPSAAEGAPVEPEPLPGDFTADDSVTNDDVVALLWHTLFPDENPIAADGDLNKDGNVTNEDVVALLWHTLFPDENPL